MSAQNLIAAPFYWNDGELRLENFFRNSSGRNFPIICIQPKFWDCPPQRGSYSCPSASRGHPQTTATEPQRIAEGAGHERGVGSPFGAGSHVTSDLLFSNLIKSLGAFPNAPFLP